MRTLPSWLPYVLPFALFLLLSQFETSFGTANYPVLYAVKLAIVAFTLVYFHRAGAYPELRAAWRFLPLAIVLGIVLCALWIGIDRFTPHFAFLGSRAGYNPWAAIHNPAERAAFIAVRFLGLVAVVPVMEELLWRSFLLRFVIAPEDFRRVPIGKFELTSCLAVVVLMALVHPEWLAAAVFSLAMNLLIYRTKNLFACILAHGATNLALGVYVIATHSWKYW